MGAGAALVPRRSTRRSTSEPAAPECGLARPALPLAYTCAAPASGTGHLTRSRPQDSASNARHRHQEPREPLGGRAPSRPLWPDVRFRPDFVGSSPSFGRGRHPRGTSQPDPKATYGLDGLSRHSHIIFHWQRASGRGVPRNADGPCPIPE